MFIITTMGSNDANAVFPFAIGKAALGQGETPSMFLMSEATRVGTTIGDAYEIRSLVEPLVDNAPRTTTTPPALSRRDASHPV